MAVLLVQLLLPLLPALAVDYCALCRVPGSHTRCLYPEPGPARSCQGYVPAPLSAAEKKVLLDTHNGLRSRVALGQGWSPNSTHDAQPKAANMRQMYWDDELADTAQRWADRCDSFYTTKPHDACRDSERFPVGQNIVTTAYNFPLAADVRSRVREWYNEIDDFDPAWVTAFTLQPVPDRPTAHYTQLVWGWSYLLGCGRAAFHEVIGGELWMVERLVCNYGPSGNFFGLPLYLEGEPCSKCPDGTSCSKMYPGLCQIDDKYNGTTTQIPPLWSFTTRPVDGSTAATLATEAVDVSSTTQAPSTTKSQLSTSEASRSTAGEKTTTKKPRTTTMQRVTTAPPTTTSTTTSTTTTEPPTTTSEEQEVTTPKDTSDMETSTEEGTTAEAMTTEAVVTEGVLENSIAE